jgi:hypothetical protein
MTGRAMRRYQMLVRVSDFGAEHAMSFSSQTAAPGMFADVRHVASEVEQHAVAQASARGPDRVHVKAAARKRLRDSLRVLGRTARAFGVDKFRVPKTNSDHALLAAAHTMTRDAGEHVEEFLAHGLPPTFLDAIDAQTRALEQADTDYHATKQVRAATTAGVEALLVRGRSLIRRLDVTVMNLFRQDPAMIAAWREVRGLAI